MTYLGIKKMSATHRWFQKKLYIRRERESVGSGGRGSWMDVDGVEEEGGEIAQHMIKFMCQSSRNCCVWVKSFVMFFQRFCKFELFQSVKEKKNKEREMRKNPAP